MKLKTKWILTGVVLAIGGMMIATWAWNATNAPQPAGKKKQVYPFYRGLEQKPITSESTITRGKNSYVFEPVLQGDLVKHNFQLKNDSDTPLALRNASSCCGTLVEAYSRRIEPGDTGVVAVVLLTDRWGGREIHGTIRVETDDPDNPEISVEVSCEVKKFADITVYKILLNGSWQKPIEGSSFVVPAEAYLFKVTGIKARKGIYIRYSYEEAEENGRKGYRVHVKNKRQSSGVYRDILYLQTDHPERPELKIRVEGRITD